MPPIHPSLLSRLRQRLPWLRDRPALSPQDAAALNIKFFGYEMARSLAANMPVRIDLRPQPIGLTCRPSTQDDMEADWCAYWAHELGIPLVFHRKLWELSYALQAIFEHGHLRPGARALGFGCGREAIPAYLASKGVFVTATDLAPRAARAAGWRQSQQHASAIDDLHHPHLCTRDALLQHVTHHSVDMNKIPPTLRNFDVVWSICALEHLGSIARGADFVIKSLETLKPGGLAVHTTEFNFLGSDRTLDNAGTVLFLRRHLERLADRLQAAGHYVAPLNFDVGRKPMDQFVDIPPFAGNRFTSRFALWDENYHLKVLCEGIPTTCYGLIIKRRS